MFNVIDLFCGCGGLSLGFKMAGYNVILGIDNDEAAINTYNKNHNGSKGVCWDLTKINDKDILEEINYKNIDIVIGGPPCQGFSISGSRNIDDPRNQLYLSYLNIVKGLKPKAFIIENVPGLVSLYNGVVKDNIIKNYSDLGYKVSYEILNSANFGVPQTRKRVFFIGLKGDVEFDFNTLNRITKNQWITAEEAISDLPLLENSLGKEKQDYTLPPQNDYQKYCRKNSDSIYNHIATNHTKKTRKIISLVPEGGNYKDLPEKYRETRKFNVAWTRYHSKKPVTTIDTGHRHHFHYKCNRVPTVREKARFQSFPDNFIFYGTKTQQSRQVGNAVPPLLAKAIAKSILKYIK